MPDLQVREYPVRPDLGRHQVLDPRSLAYRRPYTGEPIRATAWEPRIPVLDQQRLLAQGIHTSRMFDGVDDVDALGSCTGNAGTALLSVLLDKKQAEAAGLDTSSAREAEEFAIRLYAEATVADAWMDYTWPSQDCGSSGLGVAKVLHHRGLIDQYGHATTAHELCRDLQTGPVLMGMPWRDAFFEPDQDGFIDHDPNWAASGDAGGHEVCITALEDVALDEHCHLMPEHTVLRFVNSWGPSWGDHGSGRLYLTTYLALRHEIDLCQPRLDRTRS
ncbi:hypothetical protein ACFV2X_38000 [Streptomyces sp. NPDC059679]|uniref:hypothetical protein n=1 Tax=Streptomyces sp. NPDC059679 TaxID=3346903 RepID=UPI0036BA1A89